MQSLENKEKIRMASQDHAASSVNDTGTNSKIDTPLTQSGSRTVLEQTCRDLIVMGQSHGADSAVGHHASNLVELIKLPKPPVALINRQMAGLQRAMREA